MISPEIIRRYPFFAGLNFEQIETLARAAEEVHTEEGHYFFHEGDELHAFYLVLEGAIAVVIELPDQELAANQSVANQLTGELATKEVVVSTVGTGDIFGWSGLVAPYIATAGAKAITRCRVIQFDTKKLCKIFEEDPRFGYLMILKAAQVVRERLRDMRIESLAFITESAR